MQQKLFYYYLIKLDIKHVLIKISSLNGVALINTLVVNFKNAFKTNAQLIYGVLKFKND